MPDIEPITRGEALLNGEDIEPLTRFEYFLKKAGQGGGGGGAIPDYSESDIGKVLTVVSSTSTHVFIPEQSVTLNNEGESAVTGVTVPMSDISEGTEGIVTLTYNGITSNFNVVAGIDQDDNVYFWNESDDVYIYWYDSWIIWINGLSSVSLTVSMSIELPSDDVTIGWNNLAQPSGDSGVGIFIIDREGTYYIDAPSHPGITVKGINDLIINTLRAAGNITVIMNSGSNVSMPSFTVNSDGYIANIVVEIAETGNNLLKYLTFTFMPGQYDDDPWTFSLSFALSYTLTPAT